MKPHYSEAGITTYNADCRAVLPTLADCSIDSVVTDPPYELGFMGKAWDRSGIAYQVEVWRECLRVLKPGGYLLAFGGSRTYHRLACAIEDAGFEIRDQIQWIYGSGFPKSLDVSKAIDAAAGAEREALPRTRVDGKATGNGGATFMSGSSVDLDRPNAVTDAAKQWNGWGTALKPAHEPIVLARKPLIGTVAENVLQHGTGGLNIDGCRIEGTNGNGHWTHKREIGDGNIFGGGGRQEQDFGNENPNGGRWPSNVIHDGSEEVLAGFPDTASGIAVQRNGGGQSIGGQGSGIYSGSRGLVRPDVGFSDSGSAARFFYCAKASREDREDGCESLALRDTTVTVNRDPESAGVQSPRAGANRGAAAPIYGCSACGLNLQGGRVTTRCPANGEHVKVLIGYGERSRNHHPTVKPTDLMRYLCRLVTPPNETVLDPFCGSGSTGRGAVLEGLNFIGIELDAEYCAIAEKRIEAVTRQGMLMFT